METTSQGFAESVSGPAAAGAEASHKILFTPRELEHLTGIPCSTQAKGRMHGDFCPHIKMKRAVYYLKSDVLAWLAAQRKNSTADNRKAA